MFTRCLKCVVSFCRYTGACGLLFSNIWRYGSLSFVSVDLCNTSQRLDCESRGSLQILYMDCNLWNCFSSWCTSTGDYSHYYLVYGFLLITGLLILAHTCLQAQIIYRCHKTRDYISFITWNWKFTLFEFNVKVILINGQFPGPRLDVVTNDNIVLNLFNQLDQPFLLTWQVSLSLCFHIFDISCFFLNVFDPMYSQKLSQRAMW